MHRNQFNNLASGAPARLRRYKTKAMQSLETVAKHHGTGSALYTSILAKRWRGERYVTPNGIGFNVSYGTGRSEIYGHKCISMNTDGLDHLRTHDASYRGWYCRHACEDSTITGHVAALSGGRFIAFIRWTDCCGITVEDRIYHDLDDAKQQADEMARIFAEHEREWDENVVRADELADVIEDAKDELAEAIGSARYYIGRVRESGPGDCADRMRVISRNSFARARRIIADIRKAREELETMQGRLNAM